MSMKRNGLTTDSQHEVDNDSHQKENAQHGRSETVVVWTRASHSDGLGSPVVSDQSVQHGQHSNEGKQARADSADLVTEVQQTHTQGAQDHGEVQPRQEGSLVGEEHFGFHSGGQGDSLVGGHSGD